MGNYFGTLDSCDFFVGSSGNTLRGLEMTIDQEEIDFNVQLVPGSIKSAMKEAEAGSRDLWQVPIDSIRTIDNFNVRVHDEAYEARIDSIADSILQEGFYQDHPLSGYVAKEGENHIIFIHGGHTRLAAAHRAIKRGAPLEKIPVVVSQAGVDMEDLTVALVKGNDGNPLKPYEIGLVCKRLMGFGWDEKKVASRLGISDQYVKNLLSLMAAPVAIRVMVIEGRISASLAIDAIKQHGDKAVSILEKAEGKANDSGKGKVTKKHVADPAKEYSKAIKAESEMMFDLLVRVQNELESNPADFGLSGTLTGDIYAMIAKIKAVKPLAV